MSLAFLNKTGPLNSSDISDIEQAVFKSDDVMNRVAQFLLTEVLRLRMPQKDDLAVDQQAARIMFGGGDLVFVPLFDSPVPELPDLYGKYDDILDSIYAGLGVPATLIGAYPLSRGVQVSQ